MLGGDRVGKNNNDPSRARYKFEAISVDGRQVTWCWRVVLVC